MIALFWYQIELCNSTGTDADYSKIVLCITATGAQFYKK